MLNPVIQKPRPVMCRRPSATTDSKKPPPLLLLLLQCVDCRWARVAVIASQRRDHAVCSAGSYVPSFTIAVCCESGMSILCRASLSLSFNNSTTARYFYVPVVKLSFSVLMKLSVTSNKQEIQVKHIERRRHKLKPIHCIQFRLSGQL